MRNQFVLVGALAAAVLPNFVAAQQSAVPDELKPESAITSPSVPANIVYTRPTEKVFFRNYAFDALGPYALFGAAASAGFHQIGNSPPEWSQGFNGYARRFGSSYGISLVGTTTRYGLAEALKEDTIYYECECKGVLPRLRHAVISSFTDRRGSDGHRVISIPDLVSPYAGTFTAAYGWYPDRFGAKDALRMGTYGFLSSIGGNIGLEFLYGGPHSLLARAHLPISIPTASPAQDSKP